MDTFLFSLLLLLVLGGGIWIFNRLVRDRNRVLQAWSDIAVQLKRRHDLLPKLVEAVRTYAAYESKTLEQMTRLRTLGDRPEGLNARSESEQQLGGELTRLLAVAEAYPDLKADRQYLDLLRQLSDTENQIQYARRYYNGSVRNLNTRIDSFPDLLLARPLGFRHAEYFELPDASEALPPEISQ